MISCRNYNYFARLMILFSIYLYFYQFSYGCSDITQNDQQPISYQYNNCKMKIPTGYINHSTGDDGEVKSAVLTKIVVQINRSATALAWKYQVVEHYSTPYTQQEVFQAPGHTKLFSPDESNPNSKKLINASCLGQKKIKLVNEYFQAQAPSIPIVGSTGVNLIDWIPLGKNSQIIEVTPQKLTISSFSNEYATGNPSQVIECTR